MQPLETLGRYRILNELGRGAMGVVYRAHDAQIERTVALKVVNRPRADSPPVEHEAFARFLREAKLAGKLNHPNIVTIFDVGEDPQQGVSWIAMEHIDGEPLDRLLARREQLDPERVRAIGVQVASALEAAHAAGVVHRDIKPGNLILTPSGVIKVTDFGIAKNLDARVTQDGSLLGSPQYMSPEQVRSAHVDHRTDLFSLGVVLYELTTLTAAFHGDGVLEMIRAVAEQQPVPPRQRRPTLPADLEQTILKALSKNKDDRFQTAGEMRAALEAGAPVSVTDTLQSTPVTPGPATRPSRPTSRLLAVAAVVTTLLLLGLWLLSRPASEHDTPAAAGSMPGPSQAATEAEATPRPTPTPSPTPGLSFPYVLRAEHHHRIGSCDGWLRIFEHHVEYDAREHHKDDRVLGFADIRSITFTPPDQLRFEVDERDLTALGIIRKHYRFTVERDPLLPDLIAHMQREIAE
jgi:serine/threonine-protein kinase